MGQFPAISQQNKNIILLRSLKRNYKVVYNLHHRKNVGMIIKYGDVFKKVMDTENMMVVRRGDKYYCVSYHHLTCDIIEVAKKLTE